MSEINEFVLKHKGKRFCVMGGASTLSEHLPQVQADIYISANAHGVQLRAPDYAVAMDTFHNVLQIPMERFLRERTTAPIISPEEWADVRMSGWPAYPTRILSGMAAAWVAWAMGAKVVILAGMDGYNGREGAAKSAKRVIDVIRCPVRVVGGGWLTHFWPEYDPDEKFGRYTPHSSLVGLTGVDNTIRVRVNKPTDIRGIERKRGEEFTVQRHEVAFQLKHKLVFEV